MHEDYRPSIGWPRKLVVNHSIRQTHERAWDVLARSIVECQRLLVVAQIVARQDERGAGSSHDRYQRRDAEYAHEPTMLIPDASQRELGETVDCPWNAATGSSAPASARASIVRILGVLDVALVPRLGLR